MFDKLRDLPDAALLAGLIAIGLVGVVGAGLLANAYLVPDNDHDPPAQLDVQPDEDDEPFELAEESPFTLDGIISALQTDGWSVDRTSDPVELFDYDYETIRISSGDDRIDLRVYEVAAEGVVDDLVADIRRPARSVTFDHLVIRISPVDDSDRPVVGDVEDRLLDYRSSVRAQQQR